ncbi:MAG: hypothetical protein JW915_19605 [Chitinispirillaceae bacterium]|nr:hypothetical protein [Chitinispirillaceae bacterium]
MVAGNPRNFEIFEPLDFIAQLLNIFQIRVNIPESIREWYSNKNRGLRKNSVAATSPTPDIADADWEKLEPESAYVKKCRLKPVVSEVEPWAALIKAVYEACTERRRSVDPLKCPKCGGTMMVRPGSPTKIISFIEDDTTIKNILKHCGKWKES